MTRPADDPRATAKPSLTPVILFLVVVVSVALAYANERYGIAERDWQQQPDCSTWHGETLDPGEFDTREDYETFVRVCVLADETGPR